MGFGFRGASITLLAVLLVLPPFDLEAQASEPPSGPTASTPDDLARLQYLIGDWSVRSFNRNEAGAFVESPILSSYRARFMYDGLSVLAEFYGPSRRGFYGVHLISSDSERGLVHYYLNARAERRLEFLGTHGDGVYHLTRRGGYGGGGRLYRETDSAIGPEGFRKDIFESHDDGATWRQGDYYFLFERTASGEGRNGR